MMRLIAENLTAKRGESVIFQDLSFEVGKGKALIIKGPNGSGKSTLLRVVAGLLPAESGQVRISDAPQPVVHVREACHYLGHRNAMKRELTVRENLVFWQRFMGDDAGGNRMDVEDAAQKVGLAGITHLPFGYLSAGQQRRMAIAKLLVAYRPVWLLDEPTAALDHAADDMFANLVREHLEGGGLAVAATHQPLGLTGVTELTMSGFVDEADRA
ncbi:MAG: heme exporter, ATP-binding protein CcmA [Pseudomonadota bacterium]